MERKNVLKSQGGFTLIEIIAVLVILGILAAVAVPKYVNMQADAKQKAAAGQVAELKATLNLAYAKEYIKNGAAPAAGAVVTAAGFTTATAADVGSGDDVWNVKLTAADDSVTIAVLKRGADTDYNATGTWSVPD